MHKLMEMVTRNQLNRYLALARACGRISDSRTALDQLIDTINKSIGHEMYHKHDTAYFVFAWNGVEVFLVSPDGPDEVTVQFIEEANDVIFTPIHEMLSRQIGITTLEWHIDTVTNNPLNKLFGVRSAVDKQVASV